MSEAVIEIRQALRSLTRRPGLTGAAVVTLAVAIAAATAVFSVVEAVLVRDLPYPDDERLVMVWERNTLRGTERNPVSVATFLDWKRRTTSFASIGATQGAFGVALTGNGDPVRVQAANLTPDALRALAVAPLLGRSFSPAEGLRSDADVVLISERMWRTRYGADTSLIDSVITIEGSPARVVGVMPADFAFPAAGVDVWAPLTVSERMLTNRKSHSLQVVARLARDASVADAQAELDVLSTRLEQEDPEFMTGWGVSVTPLKDDVVGGVRGQLLTVLAAVILLVVVACANVAGLLVARGSSRRGEFAVRRALGARPLRLARHALTESLLLACAAGALGVALAAVGVNGIVAAIPEGVLPRVDSMALNPEVLSAALAAVLLCGLVAGLAPAVAGARAPVADALRVGRGSYAMTSSGRLRNALVVGEIVVSLVLLVTGGLLLRSLAVTISVDPGFEPAGRTVAFVYLPSSRYGSIDAQSRFFDELVRRLESVSGVTSAAATTDLPILGGNVTRSFLRAGDAGFEAGHPVAYPFRAVTPGYFRTMAIPLLRGRGFAASDAADAPPVLVVNRSLAEAVWPGREGVGERVSFNGPDGPWWTVVGVVEDVRSAGLDQPPAPAFYLPHAQRTWQWHSWAYVVVRSDVGPAPLAAAMKATIWGLDPDLPVQDLRTMDQVLGETLGRRRFVMALTAAFALLALLLTAVGLYAAVAFSVAERTREYGVRIALGARPGLLTRMVLLGGLRLTALGCVLGVLLALAAARTVATQLYGVRFWDPATAVVAVALVCAVAVAALLLPARRAASVQPMDALRTE